MKLISMTDFVLQQIEDKKGKSSLDYRDYSYNKLLKIENYANFLKEPLKLKMFVPCDYNGNVLEEVIYTYQVLIYLNYEEKKDYLSKCKAYQQAKEKVLFEGFEIKDNVVLLNDKIFFASAIDAKQFFIHYQTIEDLSNHFLSNEIILTPNAINHILG